MRRFLFASLALFGAYVLLSFANNPHAYLGTDTGGKVATLRAMDASNSLDPDVGYWAERWDPNGRVHPLYYTVHLGRRWVNATTLPALIVGSPLYNALGYRGALVVPMLGAVGCALAAAALARRLRPDDDGWLAFWVVGLASPVLIYALDFWEHAPGLALMAWGVVLLVDLAGRTRSLWWAVLAGALFGGAATMRTEAFVYVFAATAVTCLVRARTELVKAAVMGALVVAGFAVPVAANTALEHAVLGQSLRAPRAQDTVTSASGAESTDRIREAITTTIATTGGADAASILLGLGIVLAVGVAAVRRDPRGFYAAAVLFAVRSLDGFGFVPGFLVAAPLGVVGIALGWRRGPPARVAIAIAVTALPLVWALQYTGGAGPQWGGRYVLLTSFLLAVTGIAVLGDQSRRLRVLAVALAGAVTLFGLGWMHERTNGFARVAERLDARTEPVLISRVAHLVREGGGVLDLTRWLTAPSEGDLAKAGAVARAAGADRVAVVDLAGRQRPTRFGEYEYRGQFSQVQLLSGIELRVSVYELR